ncbi:translesion error-prone DNA polymerase V subunit UmuC [Enterobacter hormaechei]|uniref:Translesion error-prone DNA polymerase V subunit UmuC n=3 Tax=Enterobacteriaceae TaxID=543 RepID=A0AAW8HYW3_PLUGE|nr:MULTISPECIES: translesion error-prone DNA polymerase V subunit UmuC [Enterobacterales]MDI7676846.1 translesion error-prone DNA polymerase V subunit UmuC [Cronobacter sakazakii]MDK1051969.1 translesion error-prone DNA polymerase V subunit UmuC [Cronobacter sakazakii]MDK1282295.1 translesion error-prone DNA polymerase V subunit UmuC [Cronobacter sakazakii]MDN3794970.1 translesion error-prone DNA polymerase V subunit UmuC [Enterobacter hormaechei]MDO1078108.1 translesion error-prone DNA polyme
MNADMSDRVMTILQLLTPRVEIYSIDEAFCDLTGMRNLLSLEVFGHQIRDQIKRRTHLTVGVGIGPTKTLAKLAQYASKRWPATRGVVDLSDRQRQRKLMALVPVEEVWGIGRRLGKKLQFMGINNALQLAELSPSFIRKQFSVVVERTVRELNGIPCLGLEEFTAPKEQIICSRSFGEKPSDEVSLHQAICAHAERAAEKLRAEHQFCKRVAVFISTSPFSENEVFYKNQAVTELAVPAQDSRDIINAAIKAFDTIFVPGHRYHRAGVMLTDFRSAAVSQLTLFDDFQPHRNSEELMTLIDSINHSGKGSVWFAGQGIKDASMGWKMRRERLSPAFTTKLSDIIKVK